MGRIEKIFRGVPDKAGEVFLSRSQAGIGEKLGGGVDDDGDAGFKLKVEPKKDIGFAIGQVLAKSLIVNKLTADKVGEGRDKDKGNEGNKGDRGIKRLGEEKDKDEGVGEGGRGRILKSQGKEKKIDEKKDRGIEAVGGKDN